MNVVRAHLMRDILPRVNLAIDRYIAAGIPELTTFVQTSIWLLYADYITSFSGKH